MGYTLRAVVVGVNEYSDKRYREEARLNCARADAEEIARVLDQPTAFRVEKVDLLTDERATVGTVRESLNKVFARRDFDNNTIALFYFAGHGLHNPKDDRISLCCHDVDFADPNQGGIRLNDIYELLMRSSAECNIAIIDACFSGGIIDPAHIPYITAAEHAKRTIEALRGPDGKTIAIFAACRTDQQSRESKKRGHGIYTDRLLCGWRDGEASGSDGIVSLFGLADYLLRSFVNDRQVPKVSISSEQTIALRHGTPPAQNTAPPSPPIPVSPDQGSVIFSDADFIIPKHKPSKEAIPWRPLAGTALLALTACSFLTALTPLGRSLLFDLTFVAGIVLALLILWPSRGFALPITLLQLALLAGFGYNHFGWGTGFAPLKWLASFEYLFWIALVIEAVILAIIGLVKFGDVFNNS